MMTLREERKRQIEKEGWTEVHDDQHKNGELSDAAGLYALSREGVTIVGIKNNKLFDPWPWDFKWDKRKKHNRMRRLQIAGALIVAEMERLQRLEEMEKP
jgi:hypothetical protein